MCLFLQTRPETSTSSSCEPASELPSGCRQISIVTMNGDRSKKGKLGSFRRTDTQVAPSLPSRTRPVTEHWHQQRQNVLEVGGGVYSTARFIFPAHPAKWVFAPVPFVLNSFSISFRIVRRVKEFPVCLQISPPLHTVQPRVFGGVGGGFPVWNNGTAPPKRSGEKRQNYSPSRDTRLSTQEG